MTSNESHTNSVNLKDETTGVSSPQSQDTSNDGEPSHLTPREDAVTNSQDESSPDPSATESRAPEPTVQETIAPETISPETSDTEPSTPEPASRTDESSTSDSDGGEPESQGVAATEPSPQPVAGEAVSPTTEPVSAESVPVDSYTAETVVVETPGMETPGVETPGVENASVVTSSDVPISVESVLADTVPLESSEPLSTADEGSQPTDAEVAADSTQPTRTVRLNPTVREDQDRAQPSLLPEQQQTPTVPGTPSPPPPSTGPVALPPHVSDLDAGLEAEIEAAMSGDQQSAAATPDQSSGVADEETLETGARIPGKIQSIDGENVFLDVNFRSPAVVSRRQFDSGKAPEVGQLIEVVVDKVDRQEGLIHVNLPHGTRKLAGNWDAVSVGQIVDCVVTGKNKGGLQVTVSSLRGFLPASQVDLRYVDDLEQFVGEKLRVKITEANPQRRNLVVSRRAVLQIERAEKEKQLWETIAEGQTFQGVVKTIKNYGCFVDIGGVDGFLHVGEISWTRIGHPSEVVAEGQEIEVKVLKLDPQKKKISLGMRQLSENPWANVETKYPVGMVVSGRVTRTTDFGAFVELEPGVEGLVHISELDYQRVRKVTDVLREGQDVQAKVLEIDPRRKRISLSVKALKENPAAEKDEPTRSEELQTRKRKGPLKGGRGDVSGGGLFGNPKDFQ